ncbi:MAG: glycosyltransferase family 39 protein [Bacteroidia bacterium]
MKDKSYINWYLIFLIVCGAIIRFYNLANLSLSNDELSALSRLQFNSWSDIFYYGVGIDYHPAGIQFLLYIITSLFGFSELAIRIPFALMGIFSIILIYQIGKIWFNKQVGLIAAAFLTFLEFPILYSQIIRPYSSGLFFSLGMIFCLSKLINSDSKNKILYMLGYSLFTAACMYNHYFSFLFAAIVGFTALIIGKEKRTYIFFGGIFSILLFVPHIQMTIYQLSKGGLSDWLEIPKFSVLYKHLFFIFNESWIIISLVIVSFTINLYLNKEILFQNNRFRIISFFWFIIPVLIAFFYSKYINPVFQHSILIFSFPFLILFISSFITFTNSKLFTVQFFAISFILVSSTLFEKRYYKSTHFAQFKEVTNTLCMLQNKLGKDNITFTANLHNPYYIQYYLKKNNCKIKFKSYEFLNSGSDILKMQDIIKDVKTPYFIHVWINHFDPYEIHEVLKKEYNKVKVFPFYNAEIRLYYKTNENIKSKKLFNSINNFDNQSRFWSGNENTIKNDLNDTLNKVCILDSINLYSPNFNAKVKDVFVENKKHVIIKANYYLSENARVNLVIDFLRNGESYEWYGPSIHEYMNERNQWKEIVIVKKLPKNAGPEDDIKIYFWNTGDAPVMIDNVSVNIFENTNYSW